MACPLNQTKLKEQHSACICTRKCALALLAAEADENVTNEECRNVHRQQPAPSGTRHIVHHSILCLRPDLQKKKRYVDFVERSIDAGECTSRHRFQNPTGLPASLHHHTQQSPINFGSLKHVTLLFFCQYWSNQLGVETFQHTHSQNRYFSGSSQDNTTSKSQQNILDSPSVYQQLHRNN